MAYGTTKVDVIQSSTANVPVQFNDGNGTQVGTLCRAWVNYKGTSTQSIRASFNVSSVTYNGTGDYTVNFTTAMPDANYGFVGNSRWNDDGSFGLIVTVYSAATYTASSLRVTTKNPSNMATALDGTTVNVSVFR